MFTWLAVIKNALPGLVPGRAFKYNAV